MTQRTEVIEVPDSGPVEVGMPTDRATAFARLADDHLDAAYRLARAILRDPSEAQDATHDAVLQAWRKWSTLRDSSVFRQWFDRILVMAIYRHVLNKSHLLDLMAERLLEQVDLAPDESATWHDRLRRLLGSYQAVVASHPAAPLLLSRPFVSPAASRATEALLAILHSAGFDAGQSARFLQLISGMLLGPAIHRATWATAERDRPRDGDRQQASMNGLSADDFPHLWSAAPFKMGPARAARRLWRGRRRGAWLGLVTTPLAVVLGAGFALPSLLVGAPIRAWLVLANPANLEVMSSSGSRQRSPEAMGFTETARYFLVGWYRISDAKRTVSCVSAEFRNASQERVRHKVRDPSGLQ